ncbi:TPA: hemolysin III [Legionella pneumophila]|uniref:PAQR family membrane homeostasis protein TrhA n=1 Tax=Legionella pneumophila TaxID=446 RepID=UPI0010AA6773|nr:hemolysin III family protein [Legionella pneumophila]TIG84051.1 hemolysin III [Legionella pneumophila]HAT2159612.1 hemolysin III [Legionella pneumophila]HAT8773723.1 hemolysin III [Legionella pneumophila]HAU1061145.1 hemolysin III [Legionella pneumophila]HAU1232820.1 hemolysin III [Legionella pneumophila]
MKPLARGYIHLAAFFITLCACTILIIYSNGAWAIFASVIYSISLIGQYGVSALYHTRMWSRQKYLLLRRIDHAAIFVLIAGTATPICLLKLKYASGFQLLSILWLVAIIGMVMTTMWTNVPKWVRSLLYVAMGWVGILYFPEIKTSLDTTNIQLLVIGGVTYTLGAMIYAFKWPDPFPSVFGYHEVFHVLVVLGSGFHFCLNYNIAT